MLPMSDALSHHEDNGQTVSVLAAAPVQYSDTAGSEIGYRLSLGIWKLDFLSRGLLDGEGDQRISRWTPSLDLGSRGQSRPSLLSLGIALRL